MSLSSVRGFIRRHPGKLAGVVFALVALKAVADPAPFNPLTRLQQTFDTVEASLSLNDEQTQRWETAEAATLAQLKTDFEQHKTVHDTIKSTLAQDNPDLHALSKNLLDDMQTRLAASKTNQDNWLAVYDDLSTEQQTLVRQALLAELAKMEKMRRMGPPPGAAPQGKQGHAAF